MPETLGWGLILLLPAFWLFATQFRGLARRYAGRRGGRRFSAQQAVALLALIAVMLGAVVQWWWPL